jgi:hypothetical protein
MNELKRRAVPILFLVVQSEIMARSIKLTHWENELVDILY